MCRGGRACGGGRGLSAVTGQINADFETPPAQTERGFFMTLDSDPQASEG